MIFKKNNFRFSFLSTSMLALSVVSLGCASNRPKGTHETRVEGAAIMTVEHVDVPNRLVTVRQASGDTLTVYVDPSVKTFPQASVGDRVRVKYVESMAFELKKSGEPIHGVQVVETSKPAPGRPSGSTSTEIKATVRIESVDQGGSKVTFTGPRGRRSVQISDPGMRDYAKQLRSGDSVEVTYKEALAISLEKV